MAYITVFTPTYNRAKCLFTLFESLMKQTILDFEWVIIDDGSTDETEGVIYDLKEKSIFPILYEKKINEGKHIAINRGVQLATTEWFFIVDSDDFLTQDAIEKVMYYCKQIEGDSDFAGVVGLRGDIKGTAWSTWYGEKTFKEHIETVKYIDASCIEYRYKYKKKGDRAEIVRTSLVKTYPFPQYVNEKFMVESHLWLSIAKDKKKFRWFNEIIYITEYRDDGLTKNIKAAYINSPCGSAYIYNLILSCDGIPMLELFRASYNYYRYGKIAKKKWSRLWRDDKRKLISPIGMFIAIIRR